MKFLEARNITKIFPGVVALDHVDLEIEAGKIHCIIGENGAGKSTLIKTLTGVYEPDGGEVFIEGMNALKSSHAFKKIAYVPQELDLFRHMTVAENLFLPFHETGFDRRIILNRELYEKAVPILKRFHITARPDDMVANISVSEQQLLQIAHAIVNQVAEIIMLDEPTTSLTTQDTERLFEVLQELKNENKAIIFISHKLDEVFAIGDEITILRNGVKVAYEQVKNVDIPWVVRQMTGSDIDIHKNFRPEKTTDDVVLKVFNLTGEAFTNVSFELKKGEILGFAGLVGAGRTEIMQTVFGFLPAWGGKVFLEGIEHRLEDTSYSYEHGIIYISEERKSQGILGHLSVKKNITMPLMKTIYKNGLISSSIENELVDKVIESYHIKTSSVNQEIQYLSGGNQQKVIIGRAMYGNPKVLIFDEPTKGIDVGTKSEIYKLMKQLAEEEQIGIILISSELEEVMRCANRIISIYQGRKAGEFITAETEKETIINSIIGMKQH